MDKMLLKGMIFQGCHGVLPEEKKHTQRFQVDVILHLDLTSAGLTDRLEATVDYSQVFQLVRQAVENSSFQLIEALAEHISQVILEVFPVSAVNVTVYKPDAPVEGEFDYFAVELYRARS